MTDPAGVPPLSVQALAYAGLDALLLAVPLDLCAYLHVGDERGPQLYLRRPSLGDLEPAQAFELFSALRDLLEDTASPPPAEVGGYQVDVVRSTGSGSRGLCVVGVLERTLPREHAEVVRALSTQVMGLCHLAEALPERHSANVGRVAAESVGGRTAAEVVLQLSDGERVGRADAATSLAAVASATLVALDSSAKLTDAEEDGLGDARVILVLIVDDEGDQHVGAALAGSDPLAAAALATVRAATGG